MIANPHCPAYFDTLRSATVGAMLMLLAACSPHSSEKSPSTEAPTTRSSYAGAAEAPKPTVPSAQGPRRILFIGNSHTDFYVSLPELFQELATHNNLQVQVDELVEMGLSLDEIYEEARPKADEYFGSDDPDGNYYDFVVLQEKTPVAIDEADEYSTAVARYTERVRRNSPGAAVYVYQLMSPADFRTEPKQFLEWHQRASQNAVAAARPVNAGVVRIGDAVRDAYTGAHGYHFEVEGRDRLRHGESTLHMLNDAGFLASTLLFATVFNRVPEVPHSMTFATGTGENDSREPIEVAKAVSNPVALLRIAQSNM